MPTFPLGAAAFLWLVASGLEDERSTRRRRGGAVKPATVADAKCRERAGSGGSQQAEQERPSRRIAGSASVGGGKETS